MDQIRANLRKIPGRFLVPTGFAPKPMDLCSTETGRFCFNRDLGALRKGYTNCEEKEEGEDDDDATEEVGAL
jgi:hypothetical protein